MDAADQVQRDRLHGRPRSARRSRWPAAAGGCSRRPLMAVNVLTSDSTSAPPATAAAAVAVMSSTFGDSFTISGLPPQSRVSPPPPVPAAGRRWCRTSARRLDVRARHVQLDGRRRRATPASGGDRLDVVGRAVPGDVHDHGARHGALVAAPSRPGSGRARRWPSPIALSMPAAGLDDAGRLVAGPLVAGDRLGHERSPSRPTGRGRPAYSKAYPHVPEQVSVGRDSRSPARSAERSATAGATVPARPGQRKAVNARRSTAVVVPVGRRRGVPGRHRLRWRVPARRRRGA